LLRLQCSTNCLIRDQSCQPIHFAVPYTRDHRTELRC